MSNILDIKNHICVGCGVCAGICPSKCLTMLDNKDGGYSPTLNNNKCIDCGMCKKVCPFLADNAVNKAFPSNYLTDISLTGGFVDNYVGNVLSDVDRAHSASGGLLSAILIDLLNNNIIDYAVCAQKTNHCDPLFSMTICSSPDAINTSAGSAYYPVHYEQIVKHILAHDGRYAVVAVPCVAKALRNAATLSIQMKDRLIYVLGLTCGAMKSKYFSEQLVSVANIDYRNTISINFRNKRKDKPAHQYEARITYTENNTVKIKLAPLNIMPRHSSLKACAYCNDVFALDADATFMDAWIEPYRSQWNGTSIVCCRNNILADMINTANNHTIFVKQIAHSDVIKSQKSAIWQKMIFNPYRTQNKTYDLSDTSIGNLKTNIIDRLYYRIDFKHACLAGSIWLKCKNIIIYKLKIRFGSISKMAVSALHKLLAKHP